MSSGKLDSAAEPRNIYRNKMMRHLIKVQSTGIFSLAVIFRCSAPFVYIDVLFCYKYYRCSAPGLSK